jgi:microcystin-dependent protein
MDAYIGEVRAFCFDYAPEGWLLCNGGQYVLQQYQALFTVIGYTYGGSNSNFMVPNLGGLVLNGTGQLKPTTPDTGTGFYNLGVVGGEETVTLTTSEIPPHSHTFNAGSNTTAATFQATEVNVPVANSYISNAFEVVPGQTGTKTVQAYFDGASDTALAPNTVATIGTGAAHSNQQPYLVINYCICWQGEYPVKP